MVQFVKMKPLHKADILKSLYIDYAIAKYGANNITIGNEVMYGTTRKVVDLVMLYNGHTYAIEIKSDGDNYLRLNEQLKEYQSIFDYVIVIVGGSHKNSIQKRLSNDIGIYTVQASNITQIRRPKIQKNLSKCELLYSIPAYHLYRQASISPRQLDCDEIRTQYSKFSLARIRVIFYNYYWKKLQPKYTTFIDNRGESTFVDALSCFTSLQIVDSSNLSLHMNRHTN